MKVLWTPEALQDRIDIWDIIAKDNPPAAARMDALFTDSAARLAEHPHLGRVGVIAGTRELIAHANYRLIYEVEQETVWILVLIHTARQWPPARF